MSEHDYSIEIALLNNLMGSEGKFEHWPDDGAGIRIGWGSIEEKWGQYADITLINSDISPSPSKWWLKEAGATGERWGKGTFLNSFDEVVARMTDPGFRERNHLPPLDLPGSHT